MLDLEVREVRVVAVEDIRKMERRQIHNQRCARTQVCPVVGQQLLVEHSVRLLASSSVLGLHTGLTSSAAA